jgi:NadR type nicotinamide-nucleotide adenylyltransferase
MSVPPLRVAIVGSASSGKTTLAAALAERYGALWVPEYLREFVDTVQRVPVEDDQIHIAQTQVEREDATFVRGGKYIFCDTTPLMTAVYSRHYFGGIRPDLEALLASRRYGLTLVCAADLPWVPDGLHRESQDVSSIINRLLDEELAARGIPFVRIGGPLEERLKQVAKALGEE